eukprot:scaffold21.g2199.t1
MQGTMRVLGERRGQVLVVANLLLAFVSAVLLTTKVGGWSVTYTNQLKIFPNEGCKPQPPPPPPPTSDICLGRRAHYASLQQQHFNWQQLRELRSTLSTTAAIAQLQWQAAGAKSAAQLALLVGAGLQTLRQEAGSDMHQLCRAALAAPKVALLFLSRGTLPHHELWHRWLQDAAGRLPQRHAASFGCTPAHTELLRQACGGAMDPAHVTGVAADGNSSAAALLSLAAPPPPPYRQQHLFSIYVHSAASFDPEGAYPGGSVFENRTLGCRINPEWGSHDLVEAQRLLYRAALEDPLNSRFLLISESDVPLYPASLIWAQLMSENRSRIDSCTAEWEETHFDLRTSPLFWQPGLLNASHWRKSSQWSMVIRQHAQLMVQARAAGGGWDTAINGVFSRHCFTGIDPIGIGGFRLCPSDEHYLPTLLAFHNRSEECDCSLGNHTQTGPTFTGWWEFGEHPHTFTHDELNATLLHWLRREPAFTRVQSACRDPEFEAAESSYEAAYAMAVGWDAKQCKAVAADAGARLTPLPRVHIPEANWKCLPGHHWSPYFPGKCCDRWEDQCNLGAVQLPDPAEPMLEVDTRVSGYKPLPPGGCFLLARKFKGESTPALIAIASNCTNGLNLLGSRHCTPEELERQRQQEERWAQEQAQAAAAAAGAASGVQQLQAQQAAQATPEGAAAAAAAAQQRRRQRRQAGSGGDATAAAAAAPAAAMPSGDIWSGRWRPTGWLQAQNGGYKGKRRLRLRF